MVHLFPGFSGLAFGLAICPTLWIVSYCLKKHKAYNLDPQGIPGAFAPHLANYIRATEYMLTLATASIVLLAGSSALHPNGHLPWFFASPLVLLAFSVVYGILFMVLLILNYEQVQHGNPHTAFEYSRSEALGFSALLCFCLGYLLLVFLITR